MSMISVNLPGLFEQSKQRHAALVQFYRWFQVYECPQTDMTIQNQMDILADDVVIETYTHTANGKDAYRERLKFYCGGQNAHHLKSTALTYLDNAIQLDAQIDYQGSRQFVVNYKTTLSKTTDTLPHFKHIQLISGEPAREMKFKHSYAYNRAVSLMHYWLFCVETAKADVNRFQELVSSQFELNFSSTSVVNSWDKLKEWVKHTASQVNASAHEEKNITVNQNADGTIQLRMEFDWQGLSADNQRMVARTQHEWIIENNPSERFARIKKMIVTQLEPFRIVKEEAMKA